MFKIRRMFFYEAEEVYRIEKQCFNVSIGSLDVIINKACGESTIYLVAVAKNKIVGYCEFWVIVDEIHMNNIAVLPEFRRKGIANALLKETINYGMSHSAISMTLEVNVNNIRALNLYYSLGFISEGRRIDYYAKDQDALILWNRKLSESSF